MEIRLTLEQHGFELPRSTYMQVFSVNIYSIASFRVVYWSSDVELCMLLLLLLSCFSRVQLCATPETAAHQVPQSLGFSRQEHWSGLPFPSPMDESEK